MAAIDTEATQLDTRTEAGFAAPRERRTALRRGDALGRYVVLDVLGEGGMGIVYAAYDPELDRKLAIKLWHPAGARTEERRSRLLREAQAMARLNHPSVITVHDVGEVDGDVFVAMELVDGETLSAWVARERPGWRRVLEVFCEAGRGLAAAHAAGLIHRDFKPDNVMLGRDGRVRVMDFGLARGAAAESDEEAHAPGEREARAVDLRLTQSGARMGTPLYMAPEQHHGRPADARSDLFAFCVALYAALYGEAPFAGDTLMVLVDNVVNGVIRPAPRGDQPGWLRRVLVRGLATDPDARYPSMNALLRELTRRSGGRKRWLALGTASTLAAALAGVLVADGEEPCAGGASRFAGAWDREAQAAVQASFVASGHPAATAAAARIAENLAAYAGDWQVAYRAACEATHVRGEQSAELLDRRMLCLDRARLRVAGLVAPLRHEVDREAVDRAVEASFRLPALTACEASELTGEEGLPTDPELRARIEAAFTQLETAEALRSLVRPKDAMARIAPVLQDMESLEYGPLRVSARLLHAEILTDLGDGAAALTELDTAGRLAATIAAPSLLARAWILRTNVLTGRLGRHDAAFEWSQAAATAALLAGSPPLLELQRLRILGSVQRERGDLQAAKVALLAARDLAEATHGRDHPSVAHTEGGLGAVYERLGDFASAEAATLRALAITRDKLGAFHPDVSNSLMTLAWIADNRGNLPAAEASLREALAILRSRLGPQHQDVARTLVNLGGVLQRRGDLDEARAQLDEARRIQTATLGPEHPDLVYTLTALGSLARERGDLAAAQALFTDALPIATKALGEAHDVTLAAQFGRAQVARERGLPSARAEIVAVLAAYEAKLGLHHPELANPLTSLAKLELAEGHHAEAIATARRILAIAQKAEVGTLLVARAHLIVAEATLAQRGDLAQVSAALDAAEALGRASTAAGPWAARVIEEAGALRDRARRR
jgi:tetratricopeptide (TPR) repeat protein/tRNA A-37 threonylcarbamoyl transferase component Bud32